VIRLTNPSTGHTVRTDDDSSSFWTAAGYRPEAPKSPAKKAAPKKSGPATK